MACAAAMQEIDAERPALESWVKNAANAADLSPFGAS
jgi:hypothetical protein